ncbi:DUF1616 domain-containing protein [Methanoculleus chikugoensis]|uniref:DUF1616 domain-containing protein n=1 Tax=Methanoculleus chikugoensis TaxID=118126 RepID=A0ABM7H6F3_9EURY|nr:DUF1616 domain-containing protein [Methanoculleus chikugoensis]BBL68392.1 hypothetical protein MchiMG62_15730 [Methanoculleus chikugoensis]
MTSETTVDTLIGSLDPRTIPLDLKGAYLWAFLALAGIYAPIISESLLRVVFVLPFILFIPGYLLTAALFPARGDLDGIERVALSIGLSIAIVPLFGFALNYTPWGIRLDSIAVTLLVFGLAVGFTAQFRRRELPEESRFAVPFATYRTSIREEFSGGSASRFDRILSVALIAAVLVAAATTVFIIAVPKEGEKFTEFYILGPRGKAADYPTEFMSGTPQTVIIGIGNHEYRDITYTVETFAVESRFNNATNQSTIVSATLLDRFSVTVPHNQTVEQPYSFRIMDPDTNRIEFLLFAGTPPDNIPKNNLTDAGYRNLHLWLRVH